MTLIRILAIAVLVWLLLRMIKKQIDQYKANKVASQGKEQIGTMVRCQHCGLHIPKHEAIESANQYYCSQEHRKLEQDKDA